ncbi:protein CFAP20DC [Ambystoma mexicanum]|uniref:protein CFAP20DC n=1 Tax=Ambystoma mexicanum TaxID=8296 RepID=UPI0037E76053
MFKNEYQGGAFVEIFSAQGKDPTAKWKLLGSPSAIWKVFDKEVKTFVFVLEGSSQTNKMQLPKDNKQALGLIQRFLILQVNVPLGQDFSTELLITDLGNIKRRLYLSTIHKELSATPLHAKIPLFIIRRKIWCNLCIDLVAFTSGVFKGAVFQSLDGIIVSANCKLRRIFTMKLKPQDTSEEDDIYGTTLAADEPTDVIPRNCQFTTDVLQVTQVLDMTKMRQTDVKTGQHLTEQGTLPDQTVNKGSGISRNNRNQDVTHIAFGSKVTGPPPSTGRIARTSSEIVRSIGNRSDRSLCRTSPEKKEELLTVSGRTGGFDEASHYVNKNNMQQARTETTVLEQPFIQPHPPQDLSSDRNSIRRLRVRSAGKDRNENNNASITPGRCVNEDKLSVELSLPSCQRMNSSETLNSPSLLQQSTNQTDEWIFPERFHPEYSKPPLNHEDQKGETRNQSCKVQSYHNDVFTYLSRPRSAPHGKSQSVSMEEYKFPLDVSRIVRNEEQRGARMEDDFYGSDSSEEEETSTVIRWTSSPKSGHCSEESACIPAVAGLAIDRTLNSPQYGSSQEYLTRNYRDTVCSKTPTSDLKNMGPDSIQRNPLPPPAPSPKGSRPEFSQEPPSISRTLKDVSASQLQTSLSKKSLKEIPSNDTRLTSETSDYYWRNYQSGRLSTSELQMLASLKRQQNEELEEDGTSHGLSASQIDNCNVSISTSSDDTATWNSCLPPPANQGRHYQKEMNPLSHSNPRDWLNVFSPPITEPSQQSAGHVDLTTRKQSHQSDNTPGQDDLSTGEDEEVLTLLYDPCLNCYFDPETGKYYELA